MEDTPREAGRDSMAQVAERHVASKQAIHPRRQRLTSDQFHMGADVTSFLHFLPRSAG
jgi:hypothetical protein